MMGIAHISDLHFDRVVPAAADALAEALHTISPDLIIASGDFTMAGRPREYRSAAAFLDRLDAPIVACPGNHDIPAWNLIERFVRPLRRYEQHIGSMTHESYTDESCAILALNSARPWDLSWNWSHGRLSDRQIDHAEAFFTRHSDAPTKLLVTHHPFLVPSTTPAFRRIGNAERMISVMERCGVHGVLTGHLHQQYAASLVTAKTGGHGGVRVYQAGTTLSDRHRGEMNGFSLLHIGRGIDAVEAYRLRDGTFVPTWMAELPADAFAQETRAELAAVRPTSSAAR